MHRREWLRTGLLAGTAGVVSGFTGLAPAARWDPVDSREPPIAPYGARRAKNVIFLAYDGTGYEDASAAGLFSRRILGRPLLFDQILGAGATGSVRTHSLASVVTDSAAASTAWATGRKVLNGALSLLPDGRPLTTILELAKNRGLATGLVTTARITHATPAAWAAKVDDRDREEEIARQYLSVQPDVLLGGGSGPFEVAGREDGRDLFSEFAGHGYDVLRSSDDLARSNGSRLLGTFTPGKQHLPYEIDRRFQEHPSPSLAELTRKALTVLSGSNQGFLLQVEAGRIDHANHSNDPGGLVWDWIAADETLRVIRDFADRDGETLVVFACDHDTGGSVVYGFGPWYRDSTAAFETLAHRRCSHEWLVAHGLSDAPTPKEVREAATRYLGVPLSEAQAAEVIESLTHRRRSPGERPGHFNAHGTQPDNALGQILSTSPERRPDRPNIAFATGQHTAGLVPVVLYGAPASKGNLGVVDNTDLFRVMTDALGIDFENPETTEEQARELALAPPAVPVLHG